MADLKGISKKRKLQSLQMTRSLIGMLTRSKSQIHLLRNRSGLSRPDSSRCGNHQDPKPFVKKRKIDSPSEDSFVGYDLCSVSIKDLRLRRVFSPSSTNGVIPNCLDDTKNLVMTEAAGKCLDGSSEACENGDFRKLDLSNEDSVQSTPPDAEIFGPKRAMERNVSDFSDELLEKKPSVSLQKNDGCTEKGFHEERKGMNYSIKTVLKPCSREKLFKTPGSFSYRRLLPYLMDIEKDYPCSPVIGQCQKADNGLEEKQLLASNSQETLAEKSKITGYSLEVHNSASGKELNTLSVDSLTSQDNETSSMPIVNGEVQKLALQVSCEDQNLNCLKHDSSSTIDDSHFNKENLAGVVSSHEMLMDDSEVAKTKVESPCNAQNLEVLDQTLSTVSDKCEPGHYDEVAQNCNNDTEHSEIEGMPKATICHSSKAQHMDSVSPDLAEMEGNRKRSLQQRIDNGAEIVEEVENLDGKCMSMTPTDSDMSSRSETDDGRGNRMGCLSQGINHAIEKSTDVTFNGNNGHPSPKNKLVRNPQLHLKLSKIPGSFSYRRLLPFFTDIANDYSCASRNDQSLKVEISSKEKLLSPFFTSGKDTCLENLNGESHPAEYHTGDDITLPVTAATAMRCSSNRKLTRSPPKQVAKSPMTMDLQQEQRYLVHAAMDTNQKLETSLVNVVEPLAMSSTSLTNYRLLPEGEGAKSGSYLLPLKTEEHCINSTVKCAMSEKQIEADSLMETSVSPGIPVAGLKKGILKRNPRGCRGICTCLNCSLFRLHAERSFEFSRNQMQDAEEVALDLIKELSCLRNMLEKWFFGVEDHTSIYINQVKEACKKASNAEELAKTRLSEMNYDLNIHCRIPCVQRPSVRFANYVEEQVIPIADSSNK
ncbi:hypothetical protein DITRI_Ditri17bG0029500 [Diplodiscus trichospermus]